MPRRRSSMASPTSRAATKSCGRSAISDGKEVLASRPAPTRARRRRSPAAAPTTAPTRTRCSRVDLKAHKIVWRYKHPDRNFPFYSSAALAMGRIFVGGRDKFVHAIDMQTGKRVWTFPTRARVDSSPVVAGGRVYVGATTASSTSSTPRRARASSSSKPAARCRRRRPWRREGSSSDRRTASCSAWGRESAANVCRRSQRATSVARPTVRVTRMS